MDQQAESQKHDQKIFWIILLVVSIFFAFVFMTNFASSLKWALTSDNALLSYTSWMIHTGKIPYQEIFDFNLPGSYLVHLIIINLFDTNLEIGYRIAELVVFLAINLFSVLPFKIPLWKKTILFGIAMSYNTHILIQGPNMAFQRDTWIALGMALFFAKTYYDSKHPEILIRGRDYSLFIDFATQFVIGYLSLVKPSILVLGLAQIVLSKTKNRRIMSILGLGLPLVLIVIWLGVVGGLEDFLDIFFNYTLRIYQNHVITANYYHTKPEFILNIPIILGGFGSLIAVFRNRQYKTGLILISLIIFGLLNIAIQEKGNIYHYFPLMAALVVLLIYGIILAHRKRSKPLSVFLIAVIGAEIFLQVFMVLPENKISWNEKSEYQNAVTYSNLIASTTNPDDSIMFFDVGHGLSTAMFWQRRPMCGKFFYDLVLFNNTENPYVQSLQHELLEKVESRDCTVIMVSERSYGNFPLLDSPERIRNISGLETLLEKYYQPVDSEIGRVYVLKEN